MFAPGNGGHAGRRKEWPDRNKHYKTSEADVLKTAPHPAASGTRRWAAAGTSLNLERRAYAITGCRCAAPTNSDAVNTTAKAVSVNQKQNTKEKHSHINPLVLDCCYIWVQMRHLCVLLLMFFSPPHKTVPGNDFNSSAKDSKKTIYIDLYLTFCRKDGSKWDCWSLFRQWLDLPFISFGQRYKVQRNVRCLAESSSEACPNVVVITGPWRGGKAEQMPVWRVIL